MNRRKLAVAVTVCFFIFMIILLDVAYYGFITRWDTMVNASIPSIQNQILTSFSTWIDFVFSTLPMVVISLLISVLLWLRYKKNDGLLFAGIMLINVIAVLILKLMIHRIRPLNALISTTDFSFPSGHTATATIFFGFLSYLIVRRSTSVIVKTTTLTIAIFMVVLIGFSRVYLNVHWLTDVIGGLALGFFTLTGILLVKEKLEK
jgi:membrane-associated phospholipid phosphatase